jgi:hypothetical protein
MHMPKQMLALKQQAKGGDFVFNGWLKRLLDGCPEGGYEDLTAAFIEAIDAECGKKKSDIPQQ